MRTQKTLGIIGGMSWESTQTYYQLINKGVKDELGGLHSADIIIHSLDFAPIAALQAKDDWNELAKLLINSGLGLKRAGAEGLLIATNTMHKVADQVQLAVDLPLVHISDATSKAIKIHGLDTIALLGTKFTMNNESDEPHFYQQRLIDAGLTVLVPESKAQDNIHEIIYNELCQGQFLAESHEYYSEVINDLAKQGAQGVILGCTEIGLLIKPEDSPIPVFDTTHIHAEAGVDFLLGKTT